MTSPLPVHRARRTTLATATALALAASLAVGLPGGAEAAGRKQSAAKASFTALELISGAGVLGVEGRVPRLRGNARQKVRLQVKTKGTWVGLTSTRAKGNGSFAMATPFAWYGGHKVRVTARGFTKGKKVSVVPAYTPVGDKKSYALLGKKRSRTARFNPCRPIHYQVNASAVPATALGQVQAMMSQIGAASGLDLRYSGTTSYVPFATRKLPSRRADLVIAFAPDAAVPQFARSDSTLGLGGALRALRARDSAGRGAVMTTQAGVVLQAEAYGSYFSEATDSDVAHPPIGRLVLHEVGHALGLAHSPSATDVMYFTTWAADPDGLVHARYSAGDLTGLRKIGLAQGCLSPVRRSGRTLAVPAAVPLP